MIKWSFPSRGDGDIEGFSNPALEWFKGNPLCALAREVCQNSLDAQHDDNKPVDVVFAKTLVDTYSFPGMEELGDILHKCRDFWRVKGNEKTMGFLDNAQKDLKGNKISVLRISDYNTTGLEGAYDVDSMSSWTGLVKGSAFSAKGGNTTAAGSYGIGKAAPFINSKYQTVFYRTQNLQGEKAVQGVAHLMAFRDESYGDKDPVRRSVGYYGDAETRSPIEKIEELDQIDVRTKPGTDLFIPGFISVIDGDNDWKEQMIGEILENFLMSVEYNNLSIDIDGIKVNHDALKYIVGRYAKYAKNAVSFNKILQCTDDSVVEETMNFHGLGTLRLRLLYANDLNRKILIVRKSGMKIAEIRNLPKGISYTGILELQGEKLNEYFRNMENPTHDKWEPKRHPYPDGAKRYKNELEEWVRDTIKRKIEDMSGAESLIDTGNMFSFSGDSEEGLSNEDTPQKENVVDTTKSVEVVMGKPRKSSRNVIKSGVKTKVLMLSATPVNNRFFDLRNQLALAYEGNAEDFDNLLDTKKSVDDIFKAAQKAFNSWNKKPQEERTTAALLRMLDFDFFEILDSVTIARSRKHIEKYYDSEEIGKFPERLKPISIRPCLTDLDNAINYKEIYDVLMSLHLTLYTPSDYILASRMDKYIARTANKGKGLTQKGREQGIRRLMGINLMKRLESSVSSFALTVKRIWMTLDETIQKIEMFQGGTEEMELVEITEDEEFDFDDQNIDDFTVGKKVKIDLEDMDYVSWISELKDDREKLSLLMTMVHDINSEHDEKLNQLKGIIKEKVENPINGNNKKVLIFTAFADTADYLYENLSGYLKAEYGLETAEISGTVAGKTTIKGLRTDLNTVLTCFSPISKGRDALLPGRTDDIDVLIATDCISEGQNLQDCDYVVNYDIHWNPVRLVQRFGRVDRIGSKNHYIQLVNFWPDVDLDEYINLKGRVETRMKISVMTSTGDDNLIDEDEKGDLEYRKAQLKRLQEEVVDLEDMNNGISIMDLGLNEYRLDLLEYIKKHPEIKHQPKGLYSIVKANKESPSGVIFVLKNVKNEESINTQNRLHPFYMVYMGEDGEIVLDHLSPKDILDSLRYLCRGKKVSDQKLVDMFNSETGYGKNMEKYSELLEETISSIIEVKSESEMDSFLSGKTMSFLSETINGLNDFELITFLIVK